MAVRAKKSLTDALFETNFQTKVASELWLRLEGKEYRLVGKVIRMGRALDNDIVLEDRSCSRYHAMISVTKEGYLFEDLKSRNGIRVSGKAVSKAYLKDAEEVQIGDLKGTFFLRSKNQDQKFSTEETGIANAFIKITQSRSVEKIKSRWNNLQPKQRLMAMAGGTLVLFLLLLSLSGSNSHQALVAAQEDISNGLDRKQIVNESVSRDAFNECLEFEDLGNLRKARQCFKSLPLNNEVFTALNRVMERQTKLTELRYQEGMKAFENYYFDMAILKWQEVLLIADDSSEYRVKAQGGIQDAEQRKLLR